MTIFEYVTVAVSIILGLAIARYLSALSDLFLHRNSVRGHWIPLVWSFMTFFTALGFWWQMFSVRELVEVWTYFDFLLTVSMPIFLFLSSSLLMPRDWTQGNIDLYKFHAEHGRWGVAAFSVVFAIAVVHNDRMWGVGIFSMIGLVYFAMFATAFGAFLSRSVRHNTIWTGLFLVIYVVNWINVVNPAFSS